MAVADSITQWLSQFQKLPLKFFNIVRKTSVKGNGGWTIPDMRAAYPEEFKAIKAIKSRHLTKLEAISEILQKHPTIYEPGPGDPPLPPFLLSTKKITQAPVAETEKEAKQAQEQSRVQAIEALVAKPDEKRIDTPEKKIEPTEEGKEKKVEPSAPAATLSIEEGKEKKVEAIEEGKEKKAETGSIKIKEKEKKIETSTDVKEKERCGNSSVPPGVLKLYTRAIDNLLTVLSDRFLIVFESQGWMTSLGVDAKCTQAEYHIFIQAGQTGVGNVEDGVKTPPKPGERHLDVMRHYEKSSGKLIHQDVVQMVSQVGAPFGSLAWRLNLPGFEHKNMLLMSAPTTRVEVVVWFGQVFRQLWFARFLTVRLQFFGCDGKEIILSSSLLPSVPKSTTIFPFLEIPRLSLLVQFYRILELQEQLKVIQQIKPNTGVLLRLSGSAENEAKLLHLFRHTPLAYLYPSLEDDDLHADCTTCFWRRPYYPYEFTICNGRLYRGFTVEKPETAAVQKEKAESPTWYSVEAKPAFSYAKPRGSGVEVFEAQGLRLINLNPAQFWTNVKKMAVDAHTSDPEMGFIPNPAGVILRITKLMGEFGMEVPKPAADIVDYINVLLLRFRDLLSVDEKWSLSPFLRLFPATLGQTRYSLRELISQYPFEWFSMPTLILQAFGTPGDRRSTRNRDAAIALWLCAQSPTYKNACDGFMAPRLSTRHHGTHGFHDEVVLCPRGRDKLKYLGIMSEPDAKIKSK